ncbi:hypothetical protein [Bradyrhizobium sp. CCBAU 65884]|uniref:hypothetical protein n=1 Tax=Bradyrhizobium sp. CCBAU 65884 TaxID=722477 RepID=UPI002305E2DD|nr:hypothetical protein [Bradyrhizobium sp. CCBAU 65884]
MTDTVEIVRPGGELQHHSHNDVDVITELIGLAVARDAGVHVMAGRTESRSAIYIDAGLVLSCE